MPSISFHSNFRLLPILLALGLGASAQAQSLVDLYTAARAYDANYQSAKAQYDATLYKADQARSLVLPKVGLTSGYSGSNYESKSLPGAGTIDRGYTTQTAGISASHPLYHPAVAILSLAAPAVVRFACKRGEAEGQQTGAGKCPGGQAERCRGRCPLAAGGRFSQLALWMADGRCKTQAVSVRWRHGGAARPLS